MAAPVIDASVLHGALNRIVALARGKQVIDILRCTKIVQDGETWTVQTADIDNIAAVTIKAEGDDHQREVCVPALTLLEILEREDKDARVALQSPGLVVTGDGEYELRSLDATRFPHQKWPAMTRAGTLDAALIRSVAWATLPADRGSAFSGVYFEFTKRRIVVTNNHVMGVARVPEGEADVLVPASLALMAARMQDGDLAVETSDNLVRFSTPDAYMGGRRMAIEFPDAHAVLPREFTTTLKVDRDALLQAALRVRVLANSPAKLQRRVLMEVGPDSVTLSSREEEGHARAVVATEVEGESLTLLFAADYVVRVLRSLDTEQIKLRLSGPMKPAVFQGNDVSFVVMPQRGDSA